MTGTAREAFLLAKSLHVLNNTVYFKLKNHNKNCTKYTRTNPHKPRQTLTNPHKHIQIPRSIYMQQEVQIPWQRAVYFRRNPRDNYAFSHVEHTTISKAFPPSLCVRDMTHQHSTNTRNLRLFKEEPVLILVTGNWAEQYALNHLETLESTDPSQTHRMQALCPAVRYDHLQRLRGHSPVNSELNSNYYSMEYHSTMAQFAQDPKHIWRLESVIPFLSDILVLPRTLHVHSFTVHKARTFIWRPLMRSFKRAIAKTFKDSLFIAGHAQYKEDTLEIIRKQPIAYN